MARRGKRERGIQIPCCRRRFHRPRTTISTRSAAHANPLRPLENRNSQIYRVLVGNGGYFAIADKRHVGPSHSITDLELTFHHDLAKLVLLKKALNEPAEPGFDSVVYW